eukprot:GHRR01013277.1.p1 GENE.GHRR01013277.1~~GHRR01013277.1.p1  ORF type:complete len:1835 (+),score=708.37 GHRR01013277.1:594-6098(+)
MKPTLQSLQTLWEHFVVCGLSGSGLQTLQGDNGFLGTDHRYKAHFVDSLPHTGDHKRQPPPQLPTCCLPAGVDIILHQDFVGRYLVPRTFTAVLTEGDGTKQYASCILFYDQIPHELATKHEDLVGAKALKAVCLLSRQPYIASSEQVLRDLYHLAFLQGTSVPLPEVVNSLLAVLVPQHDGAKVPVQLDSRKLLLYPPMSIAPPPGELSLLPLVEVLRADNLVALFAAVLLEQRVLLRSRQLSLLTVIAEGVLRLLYPFKYQHVYIPVVPSHLADYLEAPTPFLMGLDSRQPVDPQVQEALVVVDLDNGSLSTGRDGGLLQCCMNHPYMLHLRNRIRMLMQPSVANVDLVGQHNDPWVVAAKQMAMQAWGSNKQALLLRIFMQFFQDILQGYQKFTLSDSLDGSTAKGFVGVQGVQCQLRECADNGSGPRTGSKSRQPSSSGLVSPKQSVVDVRAIVHHHFQLCRHSDPALIQQVMQGLPFLSFVGEQSSDSDPQAWLAAGQEALKAWKSAEEGRLKDPAGGVAQNEGIGKAQQCMPGQAASPLMPQGGYLYQSFPALVVVDKMDGCKTRRRSTTSGNKRRGAPGKRRAVSELMGSEVDLRRRSPVQASINIEDSGLRLRSNISDISSVTGGSNVGPLQSTMPLAPGLPSLTAISGSSCGSGSGGVEYSAEAGLVRRQTAVLVQLMQQPPYANDLATAEGSAVGSSQGSFNITSARLLLTVQTGGNGWFLVSKLKELITAGGTGTGSHSRKNSVELARYLSGTASSKVAATAASDASMAAACAQPAASRSKSNKPSPTKSNKLFGMSIGSFTSSSNKGTSAQATSLPGSKAEQGIDSYSSAASAASSAISPTSLSANKGRYRSGTVIESSKPAIATGSTAETDAPLKVSSISSTSVPTGTLKPPAGWDAGTSITNLAAFPEQPSVHHPGHRNATTGVPSNSSSSTVQADPAAAGAAPMAECWWGRRVSSGAFEVLGEMFNSIVEVAAEQDDFRVVLAALELACIISCKQGCMPRRRLLGTLAKNSVVHTEWFWAGAFSFAVSNSYLDATELPLVGDVVVSCLTDFTRYVTGVGVTGTTAWLLLMQLASEHLAHQPPIPPEVLLELRAYLAHQDCIANIEKHGTAQPMSTAQDMANSSATTPIRGLVGMAGLPDSVLSALKACGIAITGLNCLSGTRQAAATCTEAESAARGGQDKAVSRVVLDQHPGSHANIAADNKQFNGSLQETDPHNRQMLEQQGGGSLAFTPRLVGPATPAAIGMQQSDNTQVATPAIASVSAVNASNSDSSRDSSGSRLSPRAASQLSPQCSGRLTPQGTTVQQGAKARTPRSYLQMAGRYSVTAAQANSAVAAGPSQHSTAATGQAGIAGAAAAPNRLQNGSISTVQGDGSILQPGAQQWVAAHSKPVVAVDACNYTAVSLGLDGMLRVFDMSGGSLRFASSMALLATGNSRSTSTSSSSNVWALSGSMPIVKLWHDGRRIAVGNAQQHNMWVLDVDAAAAAVQLTGLNGPVSAIALLKRNRDALLAGLSSSSSDDSSSTSSGATVHLWDLRRPRKPTASLCFAAELVTMDAAAAAVQLTGLNGPVSAIALLKRNRDALLAGLSSSSSDDSSSTSSGATVHLWDLRRPRKPTASLCFAAELVTMDDAAATAASTPGATGAKTAADGGRNGASGNSATSSTISRPLDVQCLAVHDDGVMAAAGCHNGKVIIWDMRQPRTPLATCCGHQGPVEYLTFVPSTAQAVQHAAHSRPEPLLLSGGSDWTARVWNAAMGSCRAVCVGHGGAVTAMGVVHNEAKCRIVTGAADGTVGVWGLQGELCWLTQQHYQQAIGRAVPGST